MGAPLQSNERRSRRPIAGIAAVLLCVVVTVGGYYAWRTYVAVSLRNLGWSAGTPPQKGVLKCFPDSRKRFAWPLRHKVEWTDLYIGGCTITVRDANDLAAAKQIESLHLSCSIEPGAFVPLARLPRLSSIYLQGNRFELSDLRDLRASRSLKELFILSGSHLDGPVETGGLCEAISEISSLTRIELPAFVRAEELEPLTRLPNLRFLAVGALQVSPGLVPIFKRMSRLEELHIIAAEIVSAASAVELANAIPNLRIRPDGFVLPQPLRSQP